MKRLLFLCIKILCVMIISGCGKQNRNLPAIRELEKGLDSAEIKAAYVVDDFDAKYLDDPLGDFWWTYYDEKGTKIDITLDSKVIYGSEGNSMRIDFDVHKLNGKDFGFAGAENQFGRRLKLGGSKGVVLQMKASKVGLDVYLVVYIHDDTQMAFQSKYQTPFQYKFKTPAGCDKDWVRVVFPWSGFERATWLGKDGTWELDTDEIITMELAFENRDNKNEIGTIWVDDIRVITDKENEKISYVQKELPPFRVSQAGYRVDDKKIFLSTKKIETFNVINDKTGKSVFSGKMKYWGKDEDTAMEISTGDFTALRAEGEYHIEAEAPENLRSYSFKIAGKVFDKPAKLAARAFYLQRSGVKISDKDVSGIDIEAGHTGKAVLWNDKNGKKFDLTGGWYDAGDFGRYITTASFSVNQMLYAYEINKSFFNDGSLDIPESGNGVPDLLDEIRFELNWMLKMQREDGSVYHKITTTAFAETGLPEKDDRPLFLFGPTSVDTYGFAAAMAKASVVFKNVDEDFSRKCLRAALKAWEWTEKNPGQFPPGGFKNPPVSEYPRQGGYDLVSSDHDPDEVETSYKLWASGALFETTGERKYEKAFDENLVKANPKGRFRPMAWSDGYISGLYAYLNAKSPDPAIKTRVEDIFKNQINKILKTRRDSAYGISLKGSTGDFAYVWGSNQVVCANGFELIAGYLYFNDKLYLEAAYDHLQYIMGINGPAKAYIQGFGKNPVKSPHHNLSDYLNEPVPGFITEGPNGAFNDSSPVDALLKSVWEEGTPPGMCYIDNRNSFATNEPTIDANASFLAMISYFCR